MMISHFSWDLDKPLKDLAREYENLVNNPDLKRILFKCRGNWLPPEKTLRELGIDPAHDPIEIISMFAPPMFDTDLRDL